MNSGDDEPLATHDPHVDHANADEGRDRAAAPASIVARVLRVGVPALAALVLVLVVVGDTTRIDSDLQLITPAEALPGTELPLRALLYDDLRATTGPKLLALDVAIELRGHDGTRLGHTQLHAANGGMAGAEGGLRLPAGYQGRASLLASTRIGNDVLRVESPLRIAPDARGLSSEQRELRALQLFSEGPLRSVPGAVAPSALRVRVAGGVCVPEQPCRLLVHVGEPAAAVAIEPSGAVTPVARASQPSAETAGVVQLDVVTHGPETEVTLVASRAGLPVARRLLRLPVALGSSALSLEPRLLDAGQSPALTAPAADGGVLDLFRREAPDRMLWLRTGSLAPAAAATAWPLGPLAPGIYRVQARHDAFSSKTAAVGVIYVRASAETPAQILGTLARHVAAAGHSDALVAAISSSPQAHVGVQLEPTLRYLLALLENDLVVYPPAITSYVQRVEALRESQSEVRVFAILALALGGIALALSVGQRGLVASRRASAILVDAGQDQAGQRRARLRSVLAVIASALALLLAFVVVALYVMARGFLR